MQKTFLKLATVAFMLSFFTACNNDLNINAPWKDITVVYGLLEPTADTNWVRVQRAYLGNEGIKGGSNNADSLYYKNLNVRIEELNPAGVVLNNWVLTRTDDVVLDSGFFTTDDYRLYYFTQKVDQANKYRVVIDKPDGEGEEVNATTIVVGTYVVTEPRGAQKITFGRSGQNFSWDQPVNGRLYQATLRFFYTEINRNTGDSIQKHLDYKLPTKLGTTLTGSTSNPLKNNVSYETYFRFIQSSIPINNDVNRFARNLELRVICGAEEFATYISVSQPATGIVQDKPFYTNINNGAGIFSSRSRTEKLGMEMSVISIDSLFNGVYTCGLRFGKRIGLDTCYCFKPGAGGWICE